jgi:hypothetical protein
MSRCDEDWKDTALTPYDESLCPCAVTYGGEGQRAIGCTLKRWHEWLEGYPNTPPDTCDLADIVEGLLTNNYQLFGENDGLGMTVYIDQPYSRKTRG